MLYWYLCWSSHQKKSRRDWVDIDDWKKNKSKLYWFKNGRGSWCWKRMRPNITMCSKDIKLRLCWLQYFKTQINFDTFLTSIFERSIDQVIENNCFQIERLWGLKKEYLRMLNIDVELNLYWFKNQRGSWCWKRIKPKYVLDENLVDQSSKKCQVDIGILQKTN